MITKKTLIALLFPIYLFAHDIALGNDLTENNSYITRSFYIGIGFGVGSYLLSDDMENYVKSDSGVKSLYVDGEAYGNLKIFAMYLKYIPGLTCYMDISVQYETGSVTPYPTDKEYKFDRYSTGAVISLLAPMTEKGGFFPALGLGLGILRHEIEFLPYKTKTYGYRFQLKLAVVEKFKDSGLIGGYVDLFFYVDIVPANDNGFEMPYHSITYGVTYGFFGIEEMIRDSW
jgi:hypothetical protein